MTNKKYEIFRDLHKRGKCFILPTAWNAVSALTLEKVGFQAVGTTSWGIAAANGYADGEVMSFDEMFSVVEPILRRLSIPVSVDIESGYSENTAQILDHVRTIARSGAAGMNIEDSAKGEQISLRSLEQQREILQAIKKMLRDEKIPLFINARTDTYLQSNAENRVRETIQRASAYQDAGADCIFIPGLKNLDEIKQIADAVDVPINIMAMKNLDSTDKLQGAGVARLSLGSALFKAETAHLFSLAHQIQETCELSGLFTSEMPVLNLHTQRIARA